jgi:hypothetical protein
MMLSTALLDPLKLLLTVLATIVLLVHMQPIRYMAGIAAETTRSR